MRPTLILAVLTAGAMVLGPMATAAAQSDSGRSSSSSSERNKVSTSDELSDRKKRDEEVANAPPPPPRVKTQDGGASPMPVIPVNPGPTGQ